MFAASGAGLAAWLLALASGAASAWTVRVPTGVRVHEHAFQTLEASGSGCEFTLKLFFDAPAEQYADKKNLVRNFYRFRGRISFADGRTLDTNQFFNRTPGPRMYTLHRDTSGEGCWSKKKQKIVKLDVEGCRGKSCRVRPF